ncbi:DUF1642 domain-containing protein [Bacillus altitudinis]|uniref:DUF1642 domain-containing protein n=1 Tax=Bacillus altitudinis TaxID=293387 RepID=UPI00119D74FB|nr:DUF1642 domain-containing protein [Bacillus altitudinis]
MKPEITKKQAEAIEFLRENYTDVQILEMRVKGAGCLLYIKGDIACGSIYDLSPIELADALINGYEIEKSQVQKVRDYYEYLEKRYGEAREKGDVQARLNFTSMMTGVRETLDRFGIKIEGVNA